MFKYPKTLIKNRYIIVSLVKQDMLARYRRSVLGLLWSVLMPLGVSLIIGSVYSILWQMDVRIFLPYLFSGLTPWTYLSECLSTGTSAYTAAEGYIKQLPIDIEIFPVRVTFSALVNLGFSLIAYFLMLFIVNSSLITWNILLLIPALCIYIIFGIGMATISATAQVYIRDYAPLLQLILQALFYVSPIIYNPEMLSSRGASLIYELNPIYYYLQIMRDALMGDIPNPVVWGVAIALAIVALLCAIGLTNKTRRRIVFRL